MIPNASKNILIPIVVIIFTIGFMVFFGSGKSNIPQKVTRENIRKVEIGMSLEEVTSLLDQPFSIEPSQAYPGEKITVLNYSKPVLRARWYPMLWVYLDNDKVVHVYAKRYTLWGFDDKGVYGLSKENKWETEAFETTFP